MLRLVRTPQPDTLSPRADLDPYLWLDTGGECYQPQRGVLTKPRPTAWAVLGRPYRARWGVGNARTRGVQQEIWDTLSPSGEARRHAMHPYESQERSRNVYENK